MTSQITLQYMTHFTTTNDVTTYLSNDKNTAGKSCYLTNHHQNNLK